MLNLNFTLNGSSNEVDSEIEVLVCSKGGGGLLRERMEVVSELWDADVKVRDCDVTTYRLEFLSLYKMPS